MSDVLCDLRWVSWTFLAGSRRRHMVVKDLLSLVVLMINRNRYVSRATSPGGYDDDEYYSYSSTSADVPHHETQAE